MIKILLTSDIHLGIKRDELPITEDIRINTLKRIISLAMDHDLLLIAGDFFDNFDVSKKTVELVSKEFLKLKNNNIEIIYTPGESELDKNGNLLPYISDNLNITHVFNDINDVKPFLFTKIDQIIYIYGFPASAKIEMSHIKKTSSDGFHIGLFHVDFNIMNDNKDNSRVYTLNKSDIKTLDLDFYALGHNHHFKLFKYLNRIIGAYPGTPESTSLSETGERYILSLIIKDNDIYQIRRLNVNSITVKDIKIDCSTGTSDKIIHDILIKNKSPKSILEATLTGRRSFPLNLNNLESHKADFLNLKITDHSIPEIEILIEEFINEPSLRGKFFSVLNEKITKGEVPPHINIDELTNIMNTITRTGEYIPEEWLCR